VACVSGGYAASKELMGRRKLARPNDEVGKFGPEDRKTVVQYKSHVHKE
jgi:hypothetical protein